MGRCRRHTLSGEHLPSDLHQHNKTTCNETAKTLQRQPGSFVCIFSLDAPAPYLPPERILLADCIPPQEGGRWGTPGNKVFKPGRGNRELCME